MGVLPIVQAVHTIHSHAAYLEEFDAIRRRWTATDTDSTDFSTGRRGGTTLIPRFHSIDLRTLRPSGS